MEGSESPSRESERNRNKEGDEGRICVLRMCLDTGIPVFPGTRGKLHRRGSQHGVSKPPGANKSKLGENESTLRVQGLQKKQVANQKRDA